MSTEIKELTRLIEEERFSEEKIRKAEEKASNIKDKAEKKARETLQEAKSIEFIKDSEAEKKREIGRKKKSIEEKYQKKIQQLNKTVKNEFENSVVNVVEDVLRVEI
jgi:vacuolar-type H+-ATPase subunit H